MAHKLVITRGGCLWWDGDGWGEREEAALYDWDTLPEVLDDGEYVLEIDRHEAPFDAGYYLDSTEPDPEAWTQATPLLPKPPGYGD